MPFEYDIENIFCYHKPFGNQTDRYEQLRNEAKNLAKLIERLCPVSAERTLALRKLEESIMWANASIARNEKECIEVVGICANPMDLMYDIKIVERVDGLDKVLAVGRKLDENQAIGIMEQAINDATNAEFKSKIKEALDRLGYCGFGGPSGSIECSAYRHSEVVCKHRCPSLDPGGEANDSWVLIFGDRVCSCCGSIHPDDLIKRVRELGSGIIEPSTKEYKWYVKIPGVHNALDGAIKYYRWHDSDDNYADKINKADDEYRLSCGEVKP